MGSENDLNKMSKADVVFEEMDAAYEMKILSAHRLPDMTADYARSAREPGLEVIICGAGPNMEYLQVISVFEKPDLHVITSRWTMDKTVIISILELILLRSRGNAKKVKIFQRIFHPAVDYVF